MNHHGPSVNSRAQAMYRDDAHRDFARQLRARAQPAERHLWQYLRAAQLGVKFRRQAAVGPYILDFVCFPRKLIVELDGPQHLDPVARERDVRRTAWLASQGFRVLRFRNHELDEDILGVVQQIAAALAED